MEGKLCLSSCESTVLVDAYRKGDREVSCRAQVLLLLDQGGSWRAVKAIVLGSDDLLTQTVKKYREERMDAVVPPPDSQPPIPWWLEKIVAWLTTKTPENFGYYRRRRSCALLAEVLAWGAFGRVSAESVRRGLRQLGYVWRRQRPVNGLSDPDYGQ